MFGSASGSLFYLVLWGLIATVAMTSILEGSRGLGFSRLSLPFLIGTFFTTQRRWAVTVGFVAYTIGGWLFAFLYFLLLQASVFTLGGSARSQASCTECFCLCRRCRYCPSCTPAWRRNITLSA